MRSGQDEVNLYTRRLRHGFFGWSMLRGILRRRDNRRLSPRLALNSRRTVGHMLARDVFFNLNWGRFSAAAGLDSSCASCKASPRAWAPSPTQAGINHSNSDTHMGMNVRASRTLPVGLNPHVFKTRNR